jgi:hypothetical protein
MGWAGSDQEPNTLTEQMDLVHDILLPPAR